MANTAQTYMVYSPEMRHTVPIMDDGSGPSEYGCCVAMVEATSRREAISKAIHDPEMSPWVQEQRESDRCPFAGLRAEPYPHKDEDDDFIADPYWGE